MASAKQKKKKARKSKYADQAAALMVVNDKLMERMQILQYLVAYMFAFDVSKRSAEMAKTLEDGIVMLADEKHRSYVRQFVFEAKELFYAGPSPGQTRQ